MLKSKVFNATVTEAELYYKGSITIDEAILEAADILEGERVEVLNLNTGARLGTYAIRGKRNSGIICLNGPAARTGFKGDKVIILTYGAYSQEELRGHKARYVELNAKNEIANSSLR